MFLHKRTTFSYNTKDFNFTVKLCEEAEASFDKILQKTWKQAEEMKAFRYILNIRSNKTLKGKYKYLIQLNPDRVQCRRAPELITSMLQPFNDVGFNFTKLSQQEILFDVGNGDLNDVVAINNSPLEECHCLLLTERMKCLPQIMTEYSLRKAIEMCLLSNSWSLRAAFNSLCANASVNQLHWHLYYLKCEMLLEYITTHSYVSDVYLLTDYPAKGFCLKLSSFKSVKDLTIKSFLIINYLQLRQIAHNVYITRAKSKSHDKCYNDVRIYIWARKPITEFKNTFAFKPAACELFGHISIADESVYDTLSENDVSHTLSDVTNEYFLLIKDELKRVLQK